MSRKRVIMIIVIILTGIDIGLLWSGGPNIAADTEWDRRTFDRPQFDSSGSYEGARQEQPGEDQS